MKRFPFITLAIAAACVLIHLTQSDATLQWSRNLIVTQPWTLITSHLTHWSTSHLFWNVMALLMLGWWIERHHRRAMLRCLGWSILLIMPAVALGMPQVTHYRGLSGVTSALFILAACFMLKQTSEPLLRVIALLAMLVFTGKCVYELVTGVPAFAAMSPDILVCPIAHLAGGVAALLSFVRRRSTPRMREYRPLHSTASTLGV